ncbi:hypothetical protein BDR07DRAFT_1489808 [Suillus spraguei]|nr:hypothetical protein BDR07DRAFT_1489808 [Suillus spraguei]
MAKKILAVIKPLHKQPPCNIKNLGDPVNSSSKSLTAALEEAEHLRCQLKNDYNERKDDLRIAADKIDETVNELHTSVTECQNMIKTLSSSLDIMQERIDLLSTQLTT